MVHQPLSGLSNDAIFWSVFDAREKTALVFYPDNQTDTPVTQSNDCVRRNETGEGRRKYVTGYRQEEKQVQGDRDGWGKRIQQRVIWRDSSCITVFKQIC